MSSVSIGESTFFISQLDPSIIEESQTKETQEALLRQTKEPLTTFTSGASLPKEGRLRLDPENLQQLKATKIQQLDNTENKIKVLATLIEDAALANYPYHRDQNQLKTYAPDWTKAEFGFVSKPGFEIDKRFDNGIVTKSGLTAFVFVNHKTKELRLVFGGTTSGSSTGGLLTRNAKNPVTTLKQWVTNALNAFSKEPKSYREAAKLAESVYQSMKGKTKLEGYEFSISGHSKGGGESSYAAMLLGVKTGKAIKSINFSSAQLGKRLIENIVDTIAKKVSTTPDDEAVIKTFKEHAKHITHIKVKGDPVPAMHKLGFDIMHLGQTLTVSSKKGTIDPVAKHDQFFDHILNWINGGKQRDGVEPISYKPFIV